MGIGPPPTALSLRRSSLWSAAHLALPTALAYYYVSQNVEAQTRARFDDTTQVIQEAIERRTRAYLDAMFGARGLFYASESVTRREWDNYVEGIEPNKRFEGLQALSYAERVEPGEKKIHARRAREEDLPAQQPDLIPGGERSTYFPITYTGPLDDANESRLNYDFYAEAVHREAMDLARDTGEPRASRKVYVLTEAPLTQERISPCNRASSCTCRSIKRASRLDPSSSVAVPSKDSS